MKKSKSHLRLFTEEVLHKGKVVSLKSKQLHYLTNVMRKSISDQLIVFNNSDGEWISEIEIIRKKECLIRCIKCLKENEEISDLWLIFSPVKNVRMEFIIQKATELGVSKILPVKTSFCQFVKLNEKKLKFNAIEAAEQTGRISVPIISEFKDLALVLKNLDKDRIIFFCDESLSGNFSKHNFYSREYINKPAAILIGPEGGFSKDEKDTILSNLNVVSISLGSNILRSDTAAVSAITLYQAFYGKWYQK